MAYRVNTSGSVDCWIDGIICKVVSHKNCGFIKPQNPIPPGGYTEVFFHKTKASWDIQLNDLVQFRLMSSSPSSVKPNWKPSVISLRHIATDGTIIHDIIRGSQSAQNTTPSVPRRDSAASVSSTHSAQNVPSSATSNPISGSDESDDDDEDNELERSKQMSKHKRIRKAVIQQSRTGTISSLKEGFGFIGLNSIKPMAAVSDELTHDLYFRTNECHSGHFPVVVGDKVSFYVRDGKPGTKGPYASNVRLVRGGFRNAVIIESYVTELLEKAKEEMDATNIATKLEHLGIAVMCLPVWECIGRYSCNLSHHCLDKLLELLLFLGSMGTLQENLATLLEALLKSRLFDTTTGQFHQYLKSFVGINDVQHLSQIYNIILLMVKLVPKRARQLSAVVKPLVSSDPQSCENFLYKFVRESVKSTLGDIDYMEWDELPLVPSVDELKSGKLEAYSSLQCVKETGPYPSPEVYMDTYFRLLRVDCFSALAKGVTDLLEGRLDSRDMNVYHDIRLAGIRLAGSGNGLCVGLHVKAQKKIKWEQSSNLMFGNLLCISISGTFQDPIWATVISRELLQKHDIVIVELCSENNSAPDCETVIRLYFAGPRTVMVESPTYYRAYQPVLKALQSMDPQRMVFQEELIQCLSGGLPSYIDGNTEFDLGVIYSGLRQNKMNVTCYSWDESDLGDTTLDASQVCAVKECFRNRIAIIQGPPGTGKTFVGLKVVQLLRSLSTPIDTPILILTYKNHSLDEFLKDLLKIFPHGVARVGGRSQEAELAGCSLNDIKHKKGFRMSEDVYKQILHFKEELNCLKDEVGDAFDSLNRQRYFTDESVLKSFEDEQIEEFLSKCAWFKTKQKPMRNEHEGEWVDVSTTITQKEVRQLLVECRDAGGIRKVVQSETDEYAVLGGKICKLLKSALRLWLPAYAAFKSYERNFIGERIAIGMYEQVTKLQEETEELMPERDADELMKERLATLMSKQANADQILKDMKMFTNFENENGHLLNIAKEVADKVPISQLFNVRNLWDLEDRDKIQLVQCVLHQSFIEASKHFEDTITEYQKIYRAKEELEDVHKAGVLKRMSIVGMTLTGASIYRGLVAQIRPKVILVEEAAEVLEPQLVAVMGDWVQHLILIGDHKQLRPSVENYILSRDYHLDVSMMERLINNDSSYATLTMQNRMRPEFAELLLDIYPKLQSNLARVSANDPASCTGSAMYFWDHSEPETSERSYINKTEVERAVRLALFLVEQGYSPWKITILSPYLGQVRLLRQRVKEVEKQYSEIFSQYITETENKESSKAVPYSANSAATSAAATITSTAEKCIQVHTVDLYQGDENDFIIVSLVRSNERGEIGFLKLLNRRCVAQSRARRGLYFIGNSKTFVKHGHWKFLVDGLAQRHCLETYIPLNCPIHQEQTQLFVSTHDQIPIKKQFCHVTCDCMKACGLHVCLKTCQPRHSHTICHDIVTFTFPGCGHSGERECYRDEAQEVCRAEVPMTYKPCGHGGYRKCFEKEADVKCGESCTKVLECTHPCEKKCGEDCDQNACSVCKKIREEEAKKRREAEKLRREEARQQAEEELQKIKEQNPDEGVHKEILSPDGDTAAEYFGIEDRVKKYIQPGHNWFPKITRIEKITNMKLEVAWLKARTKAFDPTRNELKFHGTSKKSIEGIISNGFRLPSSKGQMYGRGIYFASDSSKSAQKIYTKGSKMLLLCEVLLGRSMTVDEAKKKATYSWLQQKGYDSLFAKRDTRDKGGVQFDEFVVYDPGQAIPRYIIHYEDLDCCSFTNTLEQSALGQPGAISTLTHFSIPQPKRALTMDELETHFCIAESQFLRLMNKTGQHREVQSVDYYINPQLLSKFVAMQAKMKTKYPNPKGDESKFILAFHGTRIENIDGIVNNNFDIQRLASSTGDRGYYGAGIYFSEFPSVSIGYGNTGKLLLCRVLPGKSFDCVSRMLGAPLQPGYDSHRVQADQDGRGQELVIFDADQILPCYIINYK